MSRSWVLGLSSALAVIIVAVALFGATGLRRFQKLRAETDALQQQNQILAKENQELSAEVERLKNNPAYVEKIARDQLGQIKPGETVYLVPNESAPNEGQP